MIGFLPCFAARCPLLAGEAQHEEYQRGRGGQQPSPSSFGDAETLQERTKLIWRKLDAALKRRSLSEFHVSLVHAAWD
jgi:hypothetical protein